MAEQMAMMLILRAGLTFLKVFGISTHKVQHNPIPNNANIVRDEAKYIPKYSDWR